MHEKNLFLIYLGRTGSGPRTTLDLSKEILSRKEIKNFDLLISKNNSLINETLSIKKDSFILDTPISNRDSILKLPKFIFKFIKILRVAKRKKENNFFFVMTHIWNPICMILIKIIIPKSNIFFIVHDVEIHPGDKNSKLQYFIMQVEIFLSNIITAPSQNTRQKLLTKWKKNIFITPLPVFDFGEIKEIRKISKITTFLFFGRIVKYKGLNLFLQALEIFDKEVQNKNYRVIIAGEGKIEYNEFKIIEKLNHEEQKIIIINRYLEEKEIGDIWDESDIAIISYIEASQSGIVALSINKAMPSIITPIKELIDQCEANDINNTFALIAKDLSPKSFSEKMIEILDEKIYEKLSKNAINMQKGTGFNEWVNIIIENSI